MNLAAILHNFGAEFDRVPDDLPRDIPMPQTPQPINPVSQSDEE